MSRKETPRHSVDKSRAGVDRMSTRPAKPAPVARNPANSDGRGRSFGTRVPGAAPRRSASAKARKDSQKRIGMGAAAVLVVAALAMGGAYLFGKAASGESPVDDFFDPNAKAGQVPDKTPEEMQAELDRIVEEGMFDISIASVIEFASPEAAGKACIENVPGNRYDMTVTIRLDETGEEVYASRGVAPGNYIEDIALTRELARGDHGATATFTAYDRENHVEVGTAAAKVVLAVGDAGSAGT